MKKNYLKLLLPFAAAMLGFSPASAQCPTITCPGNISVNNDAGSCGAVVTYTAPVGTNPCSTTSQTFSYTGSIVTWTVPAGVTSIHIQAKGAQGGYNTSSTTQPGLGADMQGDFTVTPGQTLKILVGQQPSNGSGNGGGGGTFVTDNSNAPLIVAGGGGGSSQGADSPDKHGQTGTSGGTGAGGGGVGGSGGNGGSIGASGFQSGAGGGLLTNGADGWTSGTGGSAFVNGGAGGPTNSPANGGFGGGGSGSSYVVGGGGGGYSGGGSGGNSTAGVGGGGGSYNAGTNQTNVGGSNTGDGIVIISYTSNAVVTTTQTAGLASGSTFPVGTTTQTFMVDDGLGNQATCSFDVIVTDNELPTITAPANITVNADAGVCGAVVNYTAPVGSDNCTSTTAMTAGLGSGSTFPVGTTTETYTVTDASGNTASASFTITVNDVEAPVINGTTITVNSDPGQCGAIVNYNAPMGTDNCSGVTTMMTNGIGSGSFFPVGTSTETYTATDASNNTATATVTIVVIDNEAPAVTCPSNVTSCDPIVNGIGVSAIENCSGTTISFSSTGATMLMGNNDASGSTFNSGVTTVTYNVVDMANNASSCSFTVTVDSAASLAAFSNGTVCTTDAPVTLPAATPAGGTYSGAGVSGSTFNPATAGTGTHYVVYTVVNGNCTTSDSTQIVVSPCTGIAENGFSSLQVFPNPASETVTIDLGTVYDNVEVRLTDIRGKVVLDEMHSGVNIIRTDLSTVAAGTYFLQVKAGDEMKIVKLVRE